MGTSRGYHSYRGRGGKGKAILAVLLVLVILAAAVVIYLQNNLVYDEMGTPHLENPWKQETAETPEEPEELDLVIQEPTAEMPPDTPLESSEPERTQIRAISVPVGPLTQESVTTTLVSAALEGETTPYTAVAVTVKDSNGSVYIDSGVAVPGAEQLAEGVTETLTALTGGEVSDLYTIARLSCFADSIAAKSDVSSLALTRTNGRIFSDKSGRQWLDPAKPAARNYLCQLAREVAQLGFDEIMLTDVSYPTTGKVSRIAYGEDAPSVNLEIFLAQMQVALEPYGVKLSIEVPADLVTEGANETSGQVLAQIAQRVDALYVPSEPEQADALAQAVAAVNDSVVFVPELAAAGDLEGEYLVY
jgi:hypothetical protein